jgi:hypothetical protein
MLIAKVALPYKGRFISKGAEVPADYKRLKEGLRRGWIVRKGGSTASFPPINPPELVVEPKEPEVKTAIIVNIIEDEPLIAGLDFLTPLAKQSLAEENILHVGDLAGWDEERLDELKGIGGSLARHLVEEYENYSTGLCPSEKEYSDDDEDDDEMPNDENE